MKAWVCHSHYLAAAQGHLAKAVLQADNHPVPEPGPGQVLVEVRVAAVDPMDCRLIAGSLRNRFPIGYWPFVPGFDAAGRVKELGRDCKRFKVDDEVVLCLGLQESCYKGSPFGPAGALAEYCVCPETQMVKVPEGTSLEKVAGLPLSGLTAYQALFTGGGCSIDGDSLGKVAEGSRVLVLGGNRGAGHLAVQMAKSAGAVVATTVPSSCLDWMVGMGANHVLSFREEDWVDTLRGQDFDLILDCVGWATTVHEMDRAGEVLKPDGQYISIIEFDMFEGLGARYAHQFKAMVPTVCIADLDVLVDWVSSGKLKVTADLVCPFRELRHALYESRSGQRRGKVLVNIRDSHGSGVEGGA